MDIHLDTDIGGDMDDLCALALALRWPGANLIGVTTAAEEGGRRAGYARYALDLAGRADVPVAAGAEADPAAGYRWRPTYLPDEPLWPNPIAARPGPISDALALLRRSIEAGAVIVALGPFTNLRLLDETWPGILRQARLVLMGGYLQPPRAGYPQWGPDADYNAQCDVASARYALEHADPLLVTLRVTAETALRAADLPAIRAAGPLGALLARQAAVWTALNPENASYPRDWPALPPDFINFLHDPLAVAVALGWDGATIETLPLTLVDELGWLRLREEPDGRPTRVTTAIDAPRFHRLWVEMVSSEGVGG
ncbi:MAG TPA: nucleoside hydrolase [Ktedonobacterales bacterium]|nr:nucleoside hydrolase [Ktedonobacterales bacterium]